MTSVSITGLLALLAGCSASPATFYMIERCETGRPRHYCEVFDEAYYDLDAEGGVEIVLRARRPHESEPDQLLTQVVHLRGVWRSVPGETVAEGTQINATVGYWILSDGVGEHLDGAGALFFKHERRKGILTGQLESASLRPKRRLAASGLLGAVTLSGEFNARRDPRRVVRIVNDMKRAFKPAPQ